MRTTAFNDVVAQPDDDFTVVWCDRHGDAPNAPVARFLEEDDGTWGCQVNDNDDNEILVDDFPTKEALIAYLESHRVQVEE